VSARGQRAESAPGPITHATPDAELAEAQLALGRPDLGAEPKFAPDEEEFEEFEGDEAAPEAPLGGDGAPPETGGTITAPGAPVPEPRARAGNRFLNFLQGSWRELQRVQWPDRPQVMQATGVVIGFVIVAAAFLGLADLVAGKLVTFILK
jgi:preprotein translocase SecE subunit